MEGKKAGLKVAFLLLVVVSIIHASLHVAVFGTGMSGVAQSGISGFAVNKLGFEGLQENNTTYAGFSFNLVGLEWLLLISMVMFSIVRQKIVVQTEAIDLNIHKVYSSTRQTKTDLDVLYEILKNNGSLKVSAAAKIFNVDEDQIVEWSKILESGDLAHMVYPRIGEPEIKLKK